MPDLSLNLEPFLLVARSTKGAAAAKVIMDATAAPGVYGFGELLDMPNIKQLQEHETLSTHYKLLQLFAYGTFEQYQADQASYPPLSPAQIEKLKHLTLVSLGMESRSLTYTSLLSVLQQPSIRALEDMVIDAIYAGIISGRMDQANRRFSVDWIVGRDLDVGSSELRDLGMRLENWCEMTQDLLSSLDTTIAQSRAQTIATREFDHTQQQQRFMAYEAFAAQAASAGPSGGKKSRQQQGNPHGVGPSVSAEASGWFNQASGSLGKQSSGATMLDPGSAFTHTRNTRSQGRRAPPSQGAGQVEQQIGGAGAGVETSSSSEGHSSRIRTLSGTTVSQETEAAKRAKRGNR